MKFFSLITFIAVAQSIKIEKAEPIVEAPEEINQESIGRITPDMLSTALDDSKIGAGESEAKAKKVLVQKQVEAEKKAAVNNA